MAVWGQLVDTEVLSYGAQWVRGKAEWHKVQEEGTKHIMHDLLELCKIGWILFKVQEKLLGKETAIWHLKFQHLIKQ